MTGILCRQPIDMEDLAVQDDRYHGHSRDLVALLWYPTISLPIPRGVARPTPSCRTFGIIAGCRNSRLPLQR